MPSNHMFQVLCVDDDEDACEMLSLLLKTQGIDVTCAPSAAEAWLKIKAQTFDLYLLDGWLPKINGFEFCRQIRESDSITPILFYSGAAYEADKQKAFAAGANVYVTKPDIEGLINATRDLVAKARAEQVAVPSVSNRFPSIEYRFSTQLFCVATASKLISH